ncbi:MAG: hypothetical protein ACE361_11975 [Aureliella sp.]
MILLLTKDLFFVPVLRTAAELAGSELTVVKQMPDNISAVPELTAVRAAVVDLSSISLADLDEIYSQLQQLPECSVKSAFGSHVHAIRLEKAADSGFTPVMTKGQLSAQANAIVASWLQPADK